MIKYKKASLILDQVAEELNSYDEAGLIDFTKLYKVLRKCNSVLGQRINPEKQDVLTIKNFKVQLPDDFESLNLAFLCHTKKINVTPPSGFHIEYKNLCEWNSTSCGSWERDCETVIYQKCNEQWREFSHFDLVRVSQASYSKCGSQVPNFFSKSGNIINIGQDGWITTTFRDGDLYLSYVGSMEDEDGDLLVLDHPITESYYEAAVIHHIFKLMYRNKEDDVQQLYHDALREMEKARIKAEMFVNMTGYDELRDLYQSQRTRLWNKFALPIVGRDYC